MKQPKAYNFFFIKGILYLFFSCAQNFVEAREFFLRDTTIMFFFNFNVTLGSNIDCSTYPVCVGGGFQGVRIPFFVKL